MKNKKDLKIGEYFGKKTRIITPKMLADKTGQSSQGINGKIKNKVITPLKGFKRVFFNPNKITMEKAIFSEDRELFKDINGLD